MVFRTTAIGTGTAVAPGIVIHLLLGGAFLFFLLRARLLRQWASRLDYASLADAPLIHCYCGQKLLRSERSTRLFVGQAVCQTNAAP